MAPDMLDDLGGGSYVKIDSGGSAIAVAHAIRRKVFGERFGCGEDSGMISHPLDYFSALVNLYRSGKVVGSMALVDYTGREDEEPIAGFAMAGDRVVRYSKLAILKEHRSLRNLSRMVHKADDFSREHGFQVVFTELKAFPGQEDKYFRQLPIAYRRFGMKVIKKYSPYHLFVGKRLDE